MAKTYKESTDAALKKRALALIESEDDETYSGKDALDRLVDEGYNPQQIRQVLEEMVHKSEVSLHQSGRLGKGV